MIIQYRNQKYRLVFQKGNIIKVTYSKTNVDKRQCSTIVSSACNRQNILKAKLAVGQHYGAS